MKPSNLLAPAIKHTSGCFTISALHDHKIYFIGSNLKNISARPGDKDLDFISANPKDETGIIGLTVRHPDGKCNCFTSFFIQINPDSVILDSYALAIPAKLIKLPGEGLWYNYAIEININGKIFTSQTTSKEARDLAGKNIVSEPNLLFNYIETQSKANLKNLEAAATKYKEEQSAREELTKFKDKYQETLIKAIEENNKFNTELVKTMNRTIEEQTKALTKIRKEITTKAWGWKGRIDEILANDQ